MDRRNFLVTGGTVFLGSTVTHSIFQEPSVAVSFDLTVEDSLPSDTDTVILKFDRFELIPRYIDKTEQNATITITLDIEGHSRIQNQENISLTNGDVISSSDLGSATPVVKDGINSSKTELEGEIKIEVTHPDVSDVYRRNFTISGSNVGSSSDNPATTASDLVGRGDGMYWVEIHGDPYKLQFIDQDVFGNGVQGWVKIPSSTIANPESDVTRTRNDLVDFQVVSNTMDANWISSSESWYVNGGGFYTGDKDTWDDTENSLNRARIKIPNSQYVGMDNVSVKSHPEADQDPDDGSDKYYPSNISDSVINDFVTNDSPFTNNQSGYPIFAWNGSDSADYSNNGIRIIKYGDELGQNWSAGSSDTLNIGSELDLVQFDNTESAPYIWVGSSDAARERIDWVDYDIYVH